MRAGQEMKDLQFWTGVNPQSRYKGEKIMGHHLGRVISATALATVLSLPAAAGTWQIDPNHSSAQFAVRHLAISTVRGAFTKVTGTVQYDDKDISKSLVEVTIDAASVDTRVADRDKDLRSDHFFDVEKYPTITFKSNKVEQVAPGKLKVIGDLTIHGVTKPVVLDVDGPTAPVKDPWGNQRVAINATTKINRQDFGVKWNATMDGGGLVVGDDVAITIDAELVQKGAGKPAN
jgi:polyisoprenoid-binding protein YceI